jgi:hypothetical protein
LRPLCSVQPGFQGSQGLGNRLELSKGPDWVNMPVRGRALVTVHGDTRLSAGDDVLVSADERRHPHLEDLFRS